MYPFFAPPVYLLQVHKYLVSGFLAFSPFSSLFSSRFATTGLLLYFCCYYKYIDPVRSSQATQASCDQVSNGGEEHNNKRKSQETGKSKSKTKQGPKSTKNRIGDHRHRESLIDCKNSNRYAKCH